MSGKVPNFYRRASTDMSYCSSHRILQKHIKRQIISLTGGFQVIADLNAYHAFITSLKVPSITADFAHLKMLGHVYVVEDAKDLAQIVRDVTRYGGAYRPEVYILFINYTMMGANSYLMLGYIRIYPAKIRLEKDRKNGR